MRRAYTYKPANITAPLFVFQIRPATAVLPWCDAEKAAYALTVARNNLDAIMDRYAAACASLGAANRLTGRMKASRRRYQAEAFRRINSARRQMREARAALLAAMTNPALASDQVAA